jgi:hypothetical protein
VCDRCITLADEALGDGDAALLGDAQGDARHHSVGLGQRAAEQRAQALGSGQPLAHVGEVGAALPGGHGVGVLAGCHARHELEDVAPCCLRWGHHLRCHQEHHQAHCCRYGGLVLHGGAVEQIKGDAKALSVGASSECEECESQR